VASLLPPIAIAVAIVLLWGHGVGLTDVVLLVVGYTLTGLGVTVGFHRLLTHRSFKTYRPIRFALALFGTMAAEGPPLTWVAHHRRHHATADHEGDPHSPHLEPGQGWRGALHGLWHAHLGWLLDERLTSNPMRYAPDLMREPEMRWISKHFLSIVLAGVLLPGLIGLAVSGTLLGFVTGLVWGGLVRLFLIHHSTYAVNSICHYFGGRSFEVDDRSGNVAWLAIPSFGESWHNNHHAFPTSVRHGLRWWQVDLSAALVSMLERAGLAWDVVRISPERQETKAASLARGAEHDAEDVEHADLAAAGRH
jgi:stearoyl-CoA desaturase (Delta-9 desaturase)